MNEATCGKLNSKEWNFNQLLQGIKELKETLHKLTNIQNEKLYKLTNITKKTWKQAKWNTKKMGEYENKLNQLEEEKEQLRNVMVQKTNLIIFQLDRQEQCTRR